MKTIIAGSRTIAHYDTIFHALEECPWEITEVVSGCARGVDSVGEQIAREHDIPVKQFPADWNQFGRSAGYRRNCEMADYAEALLAVWDGKSRGTNHMIEIAKQRGLQVHVVTLPLQ